MNVMRMLPAKAFSYLSRLLQDKQMIADGKRWIKMVEKGKEIAELFSRFTQNEFIFEARKVEALQEMMSEQERKTFTLDVSVFSMYEYFLIYAWGLHRYILNERVEPPSVSDLLLKQPSSFFADIQWAITSGQSFCPKSRAQLLEAVMNSAPLQKALQSELARLKKKKPSESSEDKLFAGSSDLETELRERARSICEAMMADYQMPLLRMVTWIFHRLFLQIYQRLDADKAALQQLCKHSTEKDGPLILVPSHKSYIDFLIVAYILFSYHIQSPHVAADDLFRNIAVIGHLLRLMGAFFVRKNQKDPVYKVTARPQIFSHRWPCLAPLALSRTVGPASPCLTLPTSRSPGRAQRIHHAAAAEQLLPAALRGGVSQQELQGAAPAENRDSVRHRRGCRQRKAQECHHRPRDDLLRKGPGDGNRARRSAG